MWRSVSMSMSLTSWNSLNPRQRAKRDGFPGKSIVFGISNEADAVGGTHLFNLVVFDRDFIRDRVVADTALYVLREFQERRFLSAHHALEGGTPTMLDAVDGKILTAEFIASLLLA